MVFEQVFPSSSSSLYPRIFTLFSLLTMSAVVQPRMSAPSPGATASATAIGDEEGRRGAVRVEEFVAILVDPF
jgi:hypothetical protein